MNFARPFSCVLTLASLSLLACGSTPGEEDGQIAVTQQAIKFGGGPGACKTLTNNALTANALTANALTANALTANALTSNALTGNSLSNNADTAPALTDPNARDVLTYIVGCALRADQTFDVSVNGVDYSYAGQLGLAPEWGDANGSCGKMCQEWVSGCVLARLDFLGLHEEISIRGETPALHACDAETDTYTVREATYYGNIFDSPQRRYACLSPGQTEDTRVCGPTVDQCVVDVGKSCEHVCDGTTKDGAFKNCRPGDGDWDDHPYHGSVTVYLKP